MVREIDWPNNYGDPEWFVHDRFGLFIHFGLYSVAARHEWGMTLEEQSLAEYQKYFEVFEPDLLKPEEWAKKAKDIGFKYVVITVKHHDGFALWDTAFSEYNITNTPYGKDLLSELVSAFKNEGIRIGFYYSLLDWQRADFLVDGYHPERNNLEYIEAHPGNMLTYQQFMKDQITELLTNYGEIDYLWFDFSYPSRDWGNSVGKGRDDWDSENLEKLILTLQPQIIINDRLDLHRGVGTPEQYQRSGGMEKNGKELIWESCQTLNGSWGYDRNNLDWKSSETIIKLLVDNVSKNGNMLLNVGPNGRGEWDKTSLDILNGVQTWMNYHSQAIYGCGSSPYKAPLDCRFTQKGNRLYLHLFSWPYRTVLLDGLGGKIQFVRLLSDGSEIQFKDSKTITGIRPSYKDLRKEITEVNIKESLDPASLVLNLPIQKPFENVPVIELILKEEL